MAWLYSGALAGAVAPMPPPRPSDLLAIVSPAPPIPPQRPESAVAPAPSPPLGIDASCTTLASSNTVIVKSAPPIRGPDSCGIEAPVALEAIVLADGRHVPLQPAPLMRCDLAATLARWIIEDVAPTLDQQNTKLLSINDADSYSCRSRNHVAGAKLSEHARGNAIDIDSFVLAPATRVALTSPQARPFAMLVRASACARFATVLGPGSDGYHDLHIHLDLEPRRNNSGLCEWRID